MALPSNILETVDAAIAQMIADGGATAQTITYGDRTVTFRSLKELMEFRASIAQTTSTRTYRLAATSKGV
jgi:hypothetical protein